MGADWGGMGNWWWDEIGGGGDGRGGMFIGSMVNQMGKGHRNKNQTDVGMYKPSWGQEDWCNSSFPTPVSVEILPQTSFNIY